MLHLSGDVVEAAGAKLFALSVVLEDGGPVNHGVGFVGAVPVDGNVHLFGSADQELRGVGFGIDAENRNLRRSGPQLRNDRVPFQVFVWGAHGLGAAGGRSAARVVLRRAKHRDQQEKDYDTANFDSLSCICIHWDFLWTSELTAVCRSFLRG